jgi:hypothetical protein
MSARIDHFSSPFLRRRAMLFSALGLPVTPAIAQNLKLNALPFADTIETNGRKLSLNGTGVHSNRAGKAYAAAMYLELKTTAAEKAINTVGTKRLGTVALRKMSSTELGQILMRGIQENNSSQFIAQHAQSIARIGALFSSLKDLRTGGSFFIDFVPGEGTILSVDGTVISNPFTNPSFFALLMSVWLGPKPADSQLKAALLGQASTVTPTASKR